MQDVRQQQFLVLLFMLQTQLHHVRQRGPLRAISPLQQGQHGGVHMCAVGLHIDQRGTGQQAALGARVARTQAS